MNKYFKIGLLSLTLLMALTTVIAYSIGVGKYALMSNTLQQWCAAYSGNAIACYGSFPGPISALVCTIVSTIMHAIILYLYFKKNEYSKYSPHLHVIATIFISLGLLWSLGFIFSVFALTQTATIVEGTDQKNAIVHIQYHFIINVVTIVLSFISLVACFVDEFKIVRM